MTASWHIRHQSIPPQARVEVVSGQAVDAGDLLATISAMPGPLIRVDVANRIGAAPRDLPRHVIRPVGSEVRRGQILALTNTFGYPMVVASPEDGTVAQVSRSLGCIYIRRWLEIPRAGVRLELKKRDEALQVDTSKVTGRSFGAWDTFKGSVVVKEFRVAAGDFVRRGQSIAVTAWSRPEMVEEIRTSVSAPCSGLIKEIDSDQGIVVIEPREATGVVALYRGRVISADLNAVELAVWGQSIAGSYGIGGTATGRLVVGRPPVEGCIWVITGPASLAELEQGRAAGVAGIWAASARHGDLEAFVGPDRLRSVTGAWDGPVVVLAEGFGQLPMAGDTEADLVAFDGHQTVLNGMTHLRAGAVRPELLILEDTHAPADGGPGVWSPEQMEAIRGQAGNPETPGADILPGMRVRGIWGQRQGWTGTVTSAQETVMLASGISARATTVRWDNGTTDPVPVRNLAASRGRGTTCA